MEGRNKKVKSLEKKIKKLARIEEKLTKAKEEVEEERKEVEAENLTSIQNALQNFDSVNATSIVRTLFTCHLKHIEICTLDYFQSSSEPDEWGELVTMDFQNPSFRISLNYNATKTRCVLHLNDLDEPLSFRSLTAEQCNQMFRKTVDIEIVTVLFFTYFCCFARKFAKEMEQLGENNTYVSYEIIDEFVPKIFLE